MWYNKIIGAVAHLARALQFVDGAIQTLAREKGLKTIAFPLISAGVYGYPQKDAIRVAIETMKLHKDNFDEITLVLFGEREFGVAREKYYELCESGEYLYYLFFATFGIVF